MRADTAHSHFGDAPEYLEAYAGVRDTRSFIFEQRKRIVLKLLGAVSGTILDAGCGPAVYTDRLFALGCAVVGVDTSEEMLSAARAKAPQATFVAASVEALPFPDRTFDAIVCVGVLEYLDGLEEALRELARVAKPGAALVVTFPNRECWLNVLDLRLRGAARFCRRRLGLALDHAMSFDYQPTYWPAGQVEARLAGNGFRVEERRFHIFRLSFLNKLSPALALWVMRRMNFVSGRRIGANAVIRARRV